MLGFSRTQGQRLSVAEGRPRLARLKRPPLPAEATCPPLEVQAPAEESNSRADRPPPLPSRQLQARDGNEDAKVTQYDPYMHQLGVSSGSLGTRRSFLLLPRFVPLSSVLALVYELWTVPSYRLVPLMVLSPCYLCIFLVHLVSD